MMIDIGPWILSLIPVSMIFCIICIITVMVCVENPQEEPLGKALYVPLLIIIIAHSLVLCVFLAKEFLWTKYV